MADLTPDDKWHVSGGSGYSGCEFWNIWKYQTDCYGGQRFLLTSKGCDRKRFYSREKAEAAAAKMNKSESKEAP